MHVQMADEAICIGKAASSESYLRIDRIISAAEIADVDAIHPGYGFLSENAHFAEVCESCNIRFIGPSPRAMNALSDKAVSRALAKKAGVETPPGSEVAWKRAGRARGGQRIGYPVMIKAVAGGGGRGMRIAHNDISLVKGYHTARTEAENVSAIPASISRSSSRIRITSRFKFLATTRGKSFTSANATARCSGGNQKLTRGIAVAVAGKQIRASCATKSARRRCGSPRRRVTRTPAR